MHDLFLAFSVNKLNQLSSRILDCLDRLSEEDIWARGDDAQNAVGNLVLHLCGNLGQWIGTGVAGRPNTRQRDQEFAARGGVSKQELKQRLEGAVADACSVVAAVPPQRLLEKTVVQNYEVSVLDAIYHVVEHFAQHTGQIIYFTKLVTRQDLGYYSHLARPQQPTPTTP
jgi:uncharacterized damage-inducible protein DinB